MYYVLAPNCSIVVLSVADGKILVHCRVGASRSATVVIAYLMLKQDKSVSEATQLVRYGT